MTKAEQILSKQCNRYTNGQCMTLSCLERGGYDRKAAALKQNTPVDYQNIINCATCEIHEAILEVRAIESEVESWQKHNQIC